MLQRLQNLCFKLILHVDKLTPTVQIHRSMNMDQLHIRRAKHCVMQMFKIESLLVPETVQNLFQKTQHSYSTRSAARSDYVTQYKRLEYGKRCFTIRGPKIWDLLPPVVKQAPDIESFKNTMKIYPWSADLIPIT